MGMSGLLSSSTMTIPRIFLPSIIVKIVRIPTLPCPETDGTRKGAAGHVHGRGTLVYYRLSIIARTVVTASTIVKRDPPLLLDGGPRLRAALWESPARGSNWRGNVSRLRQRGPSFHQRARQH